MLKEGVVKLKKLPYGISNYEKIVNNDYYYVDKTKYIEILENLAESSIMFLRPRKFGKTLFTSTLEYYYDINAKSKFEKLYGNTYIGKNPTSQRNSYHIMRFNFSGIDTSTVEATIKGFKSKTLASIKFFAEKYGLDFFINENDDAENVLYNLFNSFNIQKNGEKIYIIIDEYDHFANELLGFHTEKFKELVSKNGKVRKWYEIIKEGTETVVDRIFITGVAPITLDSLTSGFNICSDKTRNELLNEMLGFSKMELINLLNEQNISEEEQGILLPMLKENYDGYKFSLLGKEKIYNSNMCLYFLNDYIQLKHIPERLVDMNIASDYSKLSKMLELCKGDRKKEILEKTVSGEGLVSDIIEKFNPATDFQNEEFVSMLFYLGYLTINGEKLGTPHLVIPNKAMKEIYTSYFLKIIEDETSLSINQEDYLKMLEETALEGRINKIVDTVHEYLNNLSNRDFQKFDEKYVKLIFYCITMNLKLFSVKSEPEVNRKYPDILMVPRDSSKGYNSIMVEFKYLKAGEKNKLEEMQLQAKKQIEEYSQFEDIKQLPKLNKFTIVAINDEMYVQKV